MSDFSYTVQQHTPEQLRKLAERDKSVIVMENTYDRRYEPKPAKSVSELVRRLRAITLKATTPEEARRVANADAELSAFGKQYAVLFAKMTTPAFVQDERAILAVEALIDTRARVERGELSARVAEETAAGVAIRKAMADDTSRVEEVD